MRFSDFCDGKTGVGKLAKDACAVEKKWFHCEHCFPDSIAVQMIQRGRCPAMFLEFIFQTRIQSQAVALFHNRIAIQAS